MFAAIPDDRASDGGPLSDRERTHPTPDAAHANGLHVALVSTQRGWGGGEKQAALLARGVRRHGHRCTIVARRRGEFAQRMQEAGFDVRTISGSGRSVRGLLEMRSLLRKLVPDVIHANDAHALTSVGIAKFSIRIPLTVVARRVSFPIRSAFRYRRFAQGVICVSRAVTAICKDAGIERSHLRVVHDGVDPEFATSGSREDGRARLGIKRSQTLLLKVAKLTDCKGHRHLFEAFTRVRKRHPETMLALAGDGELRNDLNQLANDLGIADSTLFLGYRHDIPDLLAAADVVVHAAHTEGLCSSLIDAMMCAKPIVATTAGGIPDLLERGGDQQVAWLVKPRSDSELAEAILEALSNPDQAIETGRRAKRRAMERFTTDRMVRATLQAYRELAFQHLGDQAALWIPGLFEASDSATGDSSPATLRRSA